MKTQYFGALYAAMLLGHHQLCRATMTQYLTLPLTTLAVLAGVWLAKNLIITRLTAAVRHEFDEKMQKLRSQNEVEIEGLKQKLRISEGEIVGIRGVGLDALTKRNGVLLERKLKAVDEVWAALHYRKRGRFATQILCRLKLDEVEKRGAEGNLREFFRAFDNDFKGYSEGLVPVFQAQPYVSARAWAYFSAYNSISTVALMYIHFKANGMPSSYIDFDQMQAATLIALPHQKPLFDQIGWQASFYMLDELEQGVLAEIHQMLDGKVDDEQQIQRAAKIMIAADNAFESGKVEDILKNAPKEIRREPPKIEAPPRS
ncbi:hypothetical protein [Pandoraea sp. NPDC090278]|uniref:hypothetical protein n=1 Tax=Pandoraea sp. NPDC090278 TaxID=3364391 RepID=UPI00383AB67E